MNCAGQSIARSRIGHPWSTGTNCHIIKLHLYTKNPSDSFAYTVHFKSVAYFSNKSLIHTKAALIWTKIQKKKIEFEIMWNTIAIIIIFKNVAVITQVFSVTWSFRNHSNMLICCLRNISYHQCWKQSCCSIFLWKPWFFLTNRKSKRTAIILNLL